LISLSSQNRPCEAVHNSPEDETPYAVPYEPAMCRMSCSTSSVEKSHTASGWFVTGPAAHAVCVSRPRLLHESDTLTHPEVAARC
jgi:hypothetical protein